MINPEQLKTLLSLNPEDILIKLRVKKEDTGKILSIKLSEEEISLVQAYQDFLLEWGYIPDNSFESLFIYLFNMGCSLNKPVVEHEVKMGRAFDQDYFALKSQNKSGIKTD